MKSSLQTLPWKALFLLIPCLSCRGPEQTVFDVPPYAYIERLKTLQVNSSNFRRLPDSIAARDIRHLSILSSGPFNFGPLAKRINLGKILSVRIDGISRKRAHFDFSGFTNLAQLSIFGTDALEAIELTNLGDSLRHLVLSSDNLDMPGFDPAFVNLTFLYYHGKGTTIPQWMERLDKLKRLTFLSPNLEEIRCDICEMDSIQIFEVVDSNREEREAYLETMPVYPYLQRFKECKPGLRF